MAPNYCLRKSERALRHPLLLSHHRAIRSLASICCAFPTLTTWGKFLVLSDTSLPQALPPFLWGFVPTKGCRFRLLTSPCLLGGALLLHPGLTWNKAALTPNSVPAPSLDCFALKSVLDVFAMSNFIFPFFTHSSLSQVYMYIHERIQLIFTTAFHFW